MPITTSHKAILGASQNLAGLESESVHLVVTSPPYPMIEMWDEIMAEQNPAIKEALINGKGQIAFELMHQELDKVWQELNRVVVPGGLICINIGDATRTINNDFSLYSNHARIISSFIKLGFNNLPNIIWRKATNAPNKFMGSGMLPAGAYVTLEHEWILVFRKGGKRTFKSDREKLVRQKSSFFWEERNAWFSDVWDLTGARQSLKVDDTRERSGAFPFSLPYRLINMYSLKGDTILDPFWGTGTTTFAAIITERNSIGVEIDKNLLDLAIGKIEHIKKREINNLVRDRLKSHTLFVETRINEGKDLKHFNQNLNMPVMTSQEKEIEFSVVKEIRREDDTTFQVTHELYKETAAPKQSMLQLG